MLLFGNTVPESNRFPDYPERSQVVTPSESLSPEPAERPGFLLPQERWREIWAVN